VRFHLAGQREDRLQQLLRSIIHRAVIGVGLLGNEFQGLHSSVGGKDCEVSIGPTPGGSDRCGSWKSDARRFSHELPVGDEIARQAASRLSPREDRYRPICLRSGRKVCVARVELLLRIKAMDGCATFA